MALQISLLNSGHTRFVFFVLYFNSQEKKQKKERQKTLQCCTLKVSAKQFWIFRRKSVNAFIYLSLILLHICQVGLKGEESGLYENSGDSSVWTTASTLPKNQPLIWYKVCARIFLCVLQSNVIFYCINGGILYFTLQKKLDLWI